MLLEGIPHAKLIQVRLAGDQCPSNFQLFDNGGQVWAPETV